jgi:5-oxoprolinase (ATP-hydrolysing)
MDRGGTFTDCILLGDDGSVTTTKVLSSDEAPVTGARVLLELAPAEPIPPCAFRIGTTVATNALLERAGARVAFVVTEGFADVLAIGTQARPDLFDVRAARPRALPFRVVTTSARGSPWGEELGVLDERDLREKMARAREEGCEAVAVALLHGTVVPDLERRVGVLAREVGFDEVVLSHEAASGVGLLARAETAVTDASLSPHVTRAFVALERAMPGCSILVLQSTGDLVPSSEARGKDLVLSGPAGGVVATRALVRARGLSEAIAFDMGGTSTDVARVTTEARTVFEKEIAGVHLWTPHIDIETVAAGGGSIVRLDHGVLVVGPESAGAAPGPLTYGHPDAAFLTVTDLNVVLGRLPADRFPLPLVEERAMRALADLAASIPDVDSPEELAERALALADARMAEAIRRVTLARGHDAKTHALVVYGGAGGLHMCAVAARLGIRRMLVPPLAGLFSAWGIAQASRGRTRFVDVGPIAVDDEGVRQLRVEALDLVTAVRGATASSASLVDVCLQVALREPGAEDTILLTLNDDDDACALIARFHEEARALYGFVREARGVVAVRLVARASSTDATPVRTPLPDGDGQPTSLSRIFASGRWHENVPVFARESLVRRQVHHGPLLVLDRDATAFVATGCTVTRDDDDVLIVECVDDAHTAVSDDVATATSLALHAGAFTAIAEEMGEILRRTAVSVNMRERLDFSCALFDADGVLVVNAPHIPVHLGAMQESVRAVVAAHPSMARGDAFVTNDPQGGGSHLPDLTVVSPVFVDDEPAPAFFVASRGHHADIGGTTPGSMPPFSRTLEEEGVVLSAVPLCRGGVLLEREIRALLLAGTFPARDVDGNLADLAAQVAANHRGVGLLQGLARQAGSDRIARTMRAVRAWSAQAIEDAIESLSCESRVFADALDDGTPIVVRVAKEGARRLHIDFTGSGGAVEGNLNAPRAVTIAAVLYALRVLAARPIPLSAGCLDPITLTIPAGSVLDAPAGCAVCGGNVETSQRVVDVLLAAFGVCAASQGTMNNLTFGTVSSDARARRFDTSRTLETEPVASYYETIGGGGGAGRSFAGASGVQTHMTNTRITDVEVLERRFPLRVTRFAMRPQTGGAGQMRGGDGLEREFVALAPLDGSILSERRDRSPFGLLGGEPGARGENLLNGLAIGGKARFVLRAGDVLTIRTPGGGGFGSP